MGSTKKVVLASLVSLMMALAFLVGLVPSRDSLGVYAASGSRARIVMVDLLGAVLDLRTDSRARSIANPTLAEGMGLFVLLLGGVTGATGLHEKATGPLRQGGEKRPPLGTADVWVRVLQPGADCLKTVAGKPSRLCQACMRSSKSAAGKDSHGKECEKIAERFRGSGLLSAFACHSCSLKQLLAKLADGSVIMAVSRSVIADPDHLFHVMNPFRRPYRVLRGMWFEVPPVTDPAITRLVDWLEEQCGRDPGLESLRRLLDIYRCGPSYDGAPSLFASDVSRYCGLREACFNLNGHANSDHVVKATIRHLDILRHYQLFRKPDRQQTPHYPIATCLRSEADQVDREEPFDWCNNGYTTGDEKDEWSHTHEKVKLVYFAGMDPANVLRGTAKSLYDYSGQPWMEYLMHITPPYHELKAILDIAAVNLSSVDGCPQRQSRARVLDLLSALVSERNDETTLPAVLEFIGAYSSDTPETQMLYGGLDKLAAVFGVPIGQLRVGVNSPPPVRKVVTKSWHVRADTSCRELLTSFLDLVAYHDDLRRGTTPLVLRGYSGSHGELVKGYPSPPSLSAQDGDFGFADLDGWEIRSDIVYASLSGAYGKCRELGLQAVLESGPRIRFGRCLKDLESGWKVVKDV